MTAAGAGGAERACRVQCFGNEREPVIVIDGFSGRIEDIVQRGRDATYSPADGYPGVRSPFDPAYLALGEPLLGQALAEWFGLTKRFRSESCAFSIVSIRPEDLSPGQRRPHYDAPHGNLVAMVHYMQGPETGGTAFYRHRATGYEAITPERVAHYEAAVTREEAEGGIAPPGYCYGNSNRYEMIGEIAARPDRLIAYRGRLLHSGIIPTPPGSGTPRLTVNTFLIGEI